MAINNFIPTLWGEALIRQLDKKYVAVANCNRDWEGVIKQVGDTVRIANLAPITVMNYTKNSDMSLPADLNANYIDLRISQAKAFNFQIDDIDRVQTAPRFMEAALKSAASSLANEADRYVFALHSSIAASNKITVDAPTEETLIDAIFDGLLKLQNFGVTDDIVLEVSPAVASIILRAKMNNSTNNQESFEKGCIGYIAGCKVFVSNNIFIETSTDYAYHKCFMRTKRAITFAEQISEVIAYRPERRFSDAVKGLMLYGAQIVCPNELMLLNFGMPKA